MIYEACVDFYKKMAAKFGFWEIGERGGLEEVKKYPFGKVNFKTFFKNQKTQILPTFLSTFNTWIDSELDIFISVDAGPVLFRYARTQWVLAPKIQLFLKLFTKIYHHPVTRCNTNFAAIFSFSERTFRSSYFYKNTIYLLPTFYFSSSSFFYSFFNTLKYNTLYHYNHLSIVSIHIYV